MSEPTMTELDHLRELLDEEGVSYLSHKGDITIGYYTEDPHSVIEAMDHSLQVTGLTAEQAMRALGHTTTVDNVDGLAVDIEKLQDENAKLRGLLRDVWWHMVNAAWHEDSPNPSAFIDRMHELGVEVDG